MAGSAKEYGRAKTLPRHFQHWTRAGVFKRVWRAGLQEYEEVEVILFEPASTLNTGNVRGEMTVENLEWI